MLQTGCYSLLCLSRVYLRSSSTFVMSRRLVLCFFAASVFFCIANAKDNDERNFVTLQGFKASNKSTAINTYSLSFSYILPSFDQTKATLWDQTPAHRPCRRPVRKKHLMSIRREKPSKRFLFTLRRSWKFGFWILQIWPPYLLAKNF